MRAASRSLLMAAMGGLLVVVLSGCASVSHTPMTKETSAKLTAKKVGVVNYEAADFVPFTAGKVLFGAVGAGLMIAEGKEMVTKYDLPDPALALREQLLKMVVERRGVSVVVLDSAKPVTKDDVASLIGAYPGADYLLDVRTFNNTITYYPTNWQGYRYGYSARVRVIEVASKSIVAETLCNSAQGDDANPPSFDQLVADRAKLLKSYMAKAAAACANIVAIDLLQLEVATNGHQAAQVTGPVVSDRAQTPPPSPTVAVAAASPSPDSPVAQYRRLSRSEVTSLMSRYWEFVRPADNDRVRWQFVGATVYGTNITSPWRQAGDWRFNERDELCVDFQTRRSPNRCLILARDAERIVLIDAKAPNELFSVLELK